MPVVNLKTIKPKVWIPPTASANFKLTVEDSTGNEQDISNFITSFTIKDGVTEGIGTFEFEVVNGDGYFTERWTGMEIVRFYCDYAATATTLRFRGRLELPSFKNMMVSCAGRSESLFVMDKTVTQQYEDVDTAVILADLFDIYGDGRYTTVNVDALSGVTITINWYQKPFWDCIQDLCNAVTPVKYECYIDAALDVHYFLSGSVINNTDMIVHDQNLIEVGDFVKNNQEIRNTIIVYGAVIEGSQVLYTARDSTSIASVGIKEEIVNDSNITDETQAEEYGDYLLALKKDPPQLGDVTAFMLAGIQPGEMIRISAPDDGLAPIAYKCASYTHEYGDSSFQTTVSINKEPTKLQHILRDRVQQENAQSDTNTNPNSMDFSYSKVFSSDSGTHDDTQISADSLHLFPGKTSGTWTSATKTAASTVTQAYLDAAGDSLTGATFSVSVDGGVSYESFSIKELRTFGAPGTSLRVKIEIADTTTHIKSVTVLYK